MADLPSIPLGNLGSQLKSETCTPAVLVEPVAIPTQCVVRHPVLPLAIFPEICSREDNCPCVRSDAVPSHHTLPPGQLFAENTR